MTGKFLNGSFHPFSKGKKAPVPSHGQEEDEYHYGPEDKPADAVEFQSILVTDIYKYKPKAFVIQFGLAGRKIKPFILIRVKDSCNLKHASMSLSLYYTDN